MPRPRLPFRQDEAHSSGTVAEWRPQAVGVVLYGGGRKAVGVVLYGGGHKAVGVVLYGGGHKAVGVVLYGLHDKMWNTTG